MSKIKMGAYNKSLYRGNYRPAEYYKGPVKYAGYHTETLADVETATFADTYNDAADVEIKGASASVCDYIAADGLISQSGTPTPSSPVPIISNLPAGRYKTTQPDGIYETTITEDMRGIGTTVDKLVLNRTNKLGHRENRIAEGVLDGSADEGWYYSNTSGSYIRFICTTGIAKAAGMTNLICDRFQVNSSVYGDSYTSEGICGSSSPNTIFVRLNKTYLVGWDDGLTSAQKAALFKTWLSSNNMTVAYPLATPTRTAQTFVKVESSDAPELPMQFLTSTASADYPADVYDASGSLLVNGEVIATIPTLRKTALLPDTFTPKTGVQRVRNSNWEILSGNNITGVWTPGPLNINLYGTSLYSIHDSGDGNVPNILVFDYKTIKLNTAPWNNRGTVNSVSVKNNLVVLNVSCSEIGFTSAIAATRDEVRAYFYGYRMCNADSTSPYYKSEVPYNPATWAEWIKDSGVTADSTGITLTGTATMRFITTMPVGTKFLFLYEVFSKTGTAPLCTSKSFSWAGVPSIVGNNKIALTCTATDTVFVLYRPSAEASDTIKLTKLRVFVLPTGSQIETDSNAATTQTQIDALAAKYTFNGLCPKNWKHLTDGLGQTATLPTASYEGFNLYRMMYELATEQIIQHTPVTVPTHWHDTTIELQNDSAARLTMDATVKQMDV